jgi:hypothetical protein
MGGAAGAAASSCSTTFTPTAALLTDFSATSWNATTGKWGTTGNVTGSKFSYQGTVTGSMMTSAVTNQALSLTGTVAVGDYGGGGLSFDQCVDTTTYTGFKFTLGGSPGGCDVLFEVQTFSQQSTTNKGGCNTSTTTCYDFPRIRVPFGTTPITVRFADLAGTGMPATAPGLSSEMVGLQWQLQTATGGDAGQTACTVSMTIDDVSFVSN